MQSQVNNKKLQSQLDDFNLLCQTIKDSTINVKDRSEEEKQKRINKLLSNYSDFVEYYFPHYATSKPAKFHKDAAERVLKNPRYRGLEMWARGHAKSVTFNVLIPMWLKAKGELRTMVLVGKSEDNAQELLSDLQAELMSNQRYSADFGSQYKIGDWQEGRFTTADGCAFYAKGRGQSPRGLRKRQFRPDFIVCDDIDDDELVENPKRVRKLVKWILEALFGAMDAGRGRFICVGNLIHKKSVLGLLSENPAMNVSRVNARDKNGNPTWKEKYTKSELDDVEWLMGYISFQKEYMNNPIVEGTIFKNDWILYKPMRNLKIYETIVAYCDPSFKSSSKADYKAVAVVGKVRNEFHLIKAFVRQTSINVLVKWFYELWFKHIDNNIVASYWMESVFMQDILFENFLKEGEAQKVQLPLRPDTRAKPDKFQRIESISPYFERGEVYANEDEKDNPDMKMAIEQLLAIEKGSSTADDFPDALEGAFFIVIQQTRSKPEDKPKYVPRTRKNAY